MSDLTPYLVSAFGTILGALGGITVYQLGSIRACVTRLDDKFFKHLTAPNIHEAGLVRLEEQLKSVEKTALVAHKRMDDYVASRI